MIGEIKGKNPPSECPTPHKFALWVVTRIWDVKTQRNWFTFGNLHHHQGRVKISIQIAMLMIEVDSGQSFEAATMFLPLLERHPFTSRLGERDVDISEV